jgi:hypothetical protein
VAVLAAVAHVVVGYLYLVSGLAVPVYALLPMWVCWALLAAWLGWLAYRASWWTPVVPIVAFGIWYLTLTLGDRFLGWTA